MSDAVERLVNLAFYLIASRKPVTAEQVRTDVAGYPEDQDDAAFARMFERDKEDLRNSGLTIDFDEELQVYRLDRDATFARRVDLSDEEAAAVRAAGTALLGDPSFPFADDLRLALAKLASEFDEGEVAASVRLADEQPEFQGEAVARLADAASARKRVSFGYTNSAGTCSPHDVEPYGMFLHDGRWYLVGRDASLDETRTYAVSRMDSLQVSTRAPKTPDFERPADFNVARYVRLPFQYGPESASFEAVLRLGPALAWRAAAFSAGHGAIENQGDCALWRIEARSPERLLRFVIENGPGIEVLRPQQLAEKLVAGLRNVEGLHG